MPSGNLKYFLFNLNVSKGAKMPTHNRRIAMITGGNSGIGFAAASKLVAKDFHVILTSRDQWKSAQAIARIR